MTTGQTFIAAFWAGLASPTSVYATRNCYQPRIAGLTFSDSFAHVGNFMAAATGNARQNPKIPVRENAGGGTGAAGG